MQITVTPSYINPPQAGKKLASINADGRYYRFDPAKIPLNMFSKGTPVTFDYEESPYHGKIYYNISSIIQSSQAQASNQAAAVQNTAKDAHLTRIAIAKSCIEANATIEVAEMWLNWVNADEAP